MESQVFLQGKYTKEGKILLELNITEYNEISEILSKKVASRQYMRKYKSTDRKSTKERAGNRKTDILLSNTILPYSE